MSSSWSPSVYTRGLIRTLYTTKINRVCRRLDPCVLQNEKKEIFRKGEQRDGNLETGRTWYHRLREQNLSRPISRTQTRVNQKQMKVYHYHE